MKLPRRKFLHLAAGAAALPVVPRIARAQAYPTRPVRIVVGFAAGGGSDIIARVMGQWLSERIGQPFVIENRPGRAPTSPPKRWFGHLLTDTRSYSSIRQARSMRRFPNDLISISSAISRRSEASAAKPVSW